MKIFRIIPIVTALFFVLWFAEYAIASPPQIRNETADWKIYRSEEYGIEVKYPPRLRVKENPPYLIRGGPTHSKFHVSFFDPNKNYSEDHPFEFYASVFTNETSLPPAEWLLSMGFPASISSGKQKTINGIKSIDFHTDGGGGRTVYFFTESKVFALSLGEMRGDDFENIVVNFRPPQIEIPSAVSVQEKGKIAYTTPWGISPRLFHALQWLTVLLVVSVFILIFRPHIFKVVFAIVFSAISLILLDACFITDTALPGFCRYRALVIPVFIFMDALGDNIRTVAMRNIVMPIVVPLWSFVVWYFMGTILFAIYRRVKNS